MFGGEKFRLFLLGSFVLAIVAQNDETCQDWQCIQTAKTFLKNMNPSALPCHNFYDFMCGNFHQSHPLPPGMVRESAFTIREKYVDEKVLELMNSNNYSDIMAIQKARITFQNCIDEATIEELGEIVVPLELNTIGLPIKPPFNAPINQPNDFSRLLGKLHRQSTFTSFLFKVSTEADDNDLTKNYLHFAPTPSIYQFMTDEKSRELEVFTFRSHANGKEEKTKIKEAQDTLKNMMIKVVQYMNELTNAKYSKKTNELIENRITEVTDFLTKLELIKELKNPAEEENFGRITFITVTELQKKTDEILGGENSQININWLDYLETLFEGIRDDTRKIFEEGETIMIKNMQQFEAVLKILSEVSRKVFVSAVWWSVTQSVMPYATKELRSLYYNYYEKLANSELLPRETRCLNVVKNQYSYIFGLVLVEADQNSRNNRFQVLEMLKNIRIAFEDTITKSAWLDAGTKMAALNKLYNISQYVSFQNWMLNPKEIEKIYKTRVVIPGMYYASTRLMKLMERDQNLAFLCTHNDLSLRMNPRNPFEVNAYYLPNYNGIDIPIGILGPPFFGLGLQALNYGAIGVIMAHELGHGFDNLGMEYDTWGKKMRWWKKKTNFKYKERAKCFVNTYNDIFIPIAERKVNGELTLSENIADFLGFTHALKAYRLYVAAHGQEKFLPHFEHYSHEKLFTMSFANTYCEVSTPSFAKWQLEKDNHSPGQARILGVLKNSEDFTNIWRCTDKKWEMNPKNKCQLL